MAQKAVADQVHYVIAVGGDGTVNEIAKALIHTDTTLAIIPFGSGNGLARHLNIPLDVARAIKTINEENVTIIDYCKANEHIFFCTAGIGFDAWISKKFAEDKHRGSLTYVKNVLIEYLKYQPRSYKMITDEGVVTEKAFLIACANAAQYGNNAFIAPTASMNDGLMNISVLKPFNALEAPQLTLQLFTKRIDTNNKIDTFKSKSLQIILERPEVMHVDGEPIMMEDQINIQTIAQGLRILTPTHVDHSLIEPIQQVMEEIHHTIVSDLRDVLTKINVIKDDTAELSNRIRFAIIGTSSISETILEAAKEDPRFVAHAVYSRHQHKADAFAEKHQIPLTFTSIEDLASSNQIDAVYIASPNALHAAHTLAMLHHGKHVLCEKAIASNYKEAKIMFDVAQQNNLVLMEAMRSTLTPNFIALTEQVKKIGPIQNYFANYCQYSSKYDAFLNGEIPNAFKRELSNGALLDIGIYTIYPMVVLFGAPNQVQAVGQLLSTGVDSHGCVNFQYDQMLAHVQYSKITHSNLPSEIQGEQSTLLIDKIQDIQKIRRVDRSGKAKKLTLKQENHPYFYEISEFIDRILGQSKLVDKINTPEQSLITMQILDEIRQQIGVHYKADDER